MPFDKMNTGPISLMTLKAMKTPHYMAGGAGGVGGRRLMVFWMLKGLSEARGHVSTSYILLFSGIYLT